MASEQSAESEFSIDNNSEGVASLQDDNSEGVASLQDDICNINTVQTGIIRHNVTNIQSSESEIYNNLTNYTTWFGVLSNADEFENSFHWYYPIPNQEYIKTHIYEFAANKFNKDVSKFHICCGGKGLQYNE